MAVAVAMAIGSSVLPISFSAKPALVLLSKGFSVVNLPRTPSISLLPRRNLSSVGINIYTGKDVTAQNSPFNGCNGYEESKRMSVVGGAARVAADTSSPSASSTSSLDDLKAKGDAYFATDTRPIILFDGVCNMCNGGVNFVLDNDAEGRVRFAALQSEAGRALLARSDRSPDDISSVVLVDKDRAYLKSEAVLQTMNYLNFPFPPAAMAASLLVPLFIRDVVYDQVADNRYSIMGRSIACRLSDNRFEDRFVSS